VFLSHIAPRIRFTTHFNKKGDNDFAPWWLHQFISPLAHASLSEFDEPFINKALELPN
jgi:hypothetical protein